MLLMSSIINKHLRPGVSVNYLSNKTMHVGMFYIIFFLIKPDKGQLELRGLVNSAENSWPLLKKALLYLPILSFFFFLRSCSIVS